MAKEMIKNYTGVQINKSSTIVELAGADIDDVRNRIMKYDANGNVVLATAGTDLPIGVAIIEAGYNDITGIESGVVKAGDEVDIVVKDMTVVLAGASIKKGQEITSGANGLAAVAAEGNYVLGIALENAEANEYLSIQMVKYKA